MRSSSFVSLGQNDKRCPFLKAQLVRTRAADEEERECKPRSAVAIRSPAHWASSRLCRNDHAAGEQSQRPRFVPSPWLDYFKAESIRFQKAGANTLARMPAC
jgi:hypothetical protein